MLTAITIFETATRLIAVAQKLINAGQNAAPFVTALYGMWHEGRDLTDEERAMLLAKEQELSDNLMRPLPPKGE